MLVLSVGLGDSVVLGSGAFPVLISVLERAPNKIKIAINAPLNVGLVREELLQGWTGTSGDASQTGCLVVERKLTEGLWVEGHGYVWFLKTKGSKARLGFEGFPPDITIHRLDVWEAINGPFTVYPMPWAA